MIIIKIFGLEIRKASKTENKDSPVLGSINPYLYRVISSMINTSMRENFAIDTCFTEITEAFKNLEFGVYKKQGKDYVESSTKEAKRIKQSIDKPNHLYDFNEFIDVYLNAIYFSGSCLLRRVPSISGIGKDDLYIYINNSYQVERDQRTLEIKSFTVQGRKYSGDELKNFKLVNNFNFTAEIQGIKQGMPLTRSLEPIKNLINGAIAYNVSVMEHGGSLGGVIGIDEGENRSTPDRREKFEKEFNDKFTGTKNAGKVFIGWGKTNYTPLGTTPKDLDYVSSLQEMQKITCRQMRVPEVLIMGDNASYNNGDAFKKKMYTELIIPLARRFCSHLTYLFQDVLQENEEFYFDTSGISVLQNDNFAAIQTLVNSLMGIATINKIIEIVNNHFQLGLTDLGEQGDVVLTASNYMSLKDIIAFPDDTFNEVDRNE